MAKEIPSRMTGKSHFGANVIGVIGLLTRIRCRQQAQQESDTCIIFTPQILKDIPILQLIGSKVTRLPTGNTYVHTQHVCTIYLKTEKAHSSRRDESKCIKFEVLRLRSVQMKVINT